MKNNENNDNNSENNDNNSENNDNNIPEVSAEKQKEDSNELEEKPKETN